MREIKFRAWEKEKNEMVSLTSNTFKELMLNDCFEKLQENFELMQYTGLKDKNGNEIYEGDIVASVGRIAEIIWLDDECGFYAKTKTGDCDEVVLKFTHNSFLVVIGNIYEHRHLIKES